MGFVAETVELFRAEQQLKRGEMEPGEFLELTDGMNRSEEAFRFVRATVLAVLHTPLVQVFWLVGLATILPLLAALLLTGPGGLQAVFVLYAVVRGLVGVQDTAMMVWAHRSGFIPFTSSLTGTVLGTLPYPYAHVVGPAVWTVLELLIYSVFIFLPGALQSVEVLFPGLVAAISALGLLQVTVHTLVRGGVNLMIVWEMPRLSEPDTFHRIRSTTWRLKNRLLGRRPLEVERAQAVWDELRDDLEGPAWSDLEGELEGLEPDERERVGSYLLASRKDEMILRNLLAERPVSDR